MAFILSNAGFGSLSVVRDSIDRGKIPGDAFCFDRVRRQMLPAMPYDYKGKERYVELPVLYSKDVYERFLKMYGYHAFLEEHKDLTDFEFEVAVREYADEHDFEEELYSFVKFYEDSYRYDWIQKNGIENMKIGYDKMVKEKGFRNLTLEEIRKRVTAYNIEQYLLEAAEEEAYKESRKYSHASEIDGH